VIGNGLDKLIERFVVEKHRAIAFEARLVMHNHTWEGEGPCHVGTVQTQRQISWQLLVTLVNVGYPCQLLVTLVNCWLPLLNVGLPLSSDRSKTRAYAEPN
jgi:hypothetical protein